MSGRSGRRPPNQHNLPNVARRTQTQPAPPVQVNHNVTSTSLQMQWKSALPPAAELERLHRAFPDVNIAERMMKMAEESLKHQQKMDEAAIALDNKTVDIVGGAATAQQSHRNLVTWLSFAVTVAALACATWLGSEGASGTVVGLIAGFGGGGGILGVVLSRLGKSPPPTPPIPPPDG